ncbi:hypothetical protein F5B21DRAFT_495604 [Xylaria acuta]|nr:hypothetical protein F5B21DRAFT_495604 [Xylaria acuta]
MFTGTSSNPVSIPTPGSSKRHACDRCRKSKLRCPPRENASQACDRCLSLGIYCTTTDENAPSAPIEISAGMSVLRSGYACRITPPLLDTLSAAWPGETSRNDKVMPISPTPDPFTWLSMFPLGNGHLSPAMGGEAVDWTAPDSFTLSMHPESGSGLSSDPGRDANPLSAIRLSTRLARLRMKLSLHLQQCLEDTTGFWDGDMDLKEQQQAAAAAQNPFGEALCYTSELLTIIRLFPRQALGDASSSPSTSVFGTINLVAMLDILSAHTQIISIYDGLFQRLYAKLRSAVGQEAPDLSASRLQTLPGLQLAGFSVLQGNLQTKILMQAMMHQLKTLEKELSLPAELCVSKQTETYLDGLVRRDMRTRHVVNSFFASNAQYSTEHVSSLREAIYRLRGVLDI